MKLLLNRNQTSIETEELFALLIPVPANAWNMHKVACIKADIFDANDIGHLFGHILLPTDAVEHARKGRGFPDILLTYYEDDNSWRPIVSAKELPPVDKELIAANWGFVTCPHLRIMRPLIRARRRLDGLKPLFPLLIFHPVQVGRLPPGSIMPIPARYGTIEVDFHL
jgi:hypothetical protein